MISEIVFTIYRVVAFIFGMILIYAALFLYKDEKNQIQDHLEKWWIKINDYRKTGIGKVASLLKSSSLLTYYIIKKLFGREIFSKKAIWGSFTFTSVSFFINYILIFLMFPQDIDLELLKKLGLSVFFPIVFISTQNKPLLRDVFCSIFTFSFFVYLYTIREEMGYYPGLWIFADSQTIPGNLAFSISLGIIILSILSDFIFISLLKNWILKSANSDSLKSILPPLLLTSLIGILLVLIPELFEIKFIWSVYDKFFSYLAIGNFLSALFGFIVFLVSLILLINQFLSPLIERIIYFLAAEKIIQRKKLLAICGLILIATGYPSLWRYIDTFFNLF